MRRGEAGTTLTELLVVMAILSILAVTALPFAETSVQRRAELALRETLRTTRTAIDAFHADWRAGRMEADAASANGYPRALGDLVSGVEVADADGTIVRRRYLRRLPENPFAPEDGWRLIGYTQDGPNWDGEDVWDLRPRTDREALDGSAIAEW
ncbi:MAG: type II secretion system protein [Pseudomonadota bacterium]